MSKIFVFGSNLHGIHGAGAAAFAHAERGAVMGVGVGLTGQSYALPTKRTPWETLGLSEIQEYVDQFLEFARTHPELQFQVTRVGCGLAGYEDEDIAPLFQGAPENCELPKGWRK
jgi:hypothetical protein